MYYYCPRVPNFSSFHSTTSRFETNAPNDPQIDLNTTGSNIPHISVSSIHESHISLRFKRSEMWDSWIVETHILSFYDQPFSSYRPFLSAPNDPKLILNPTRSNQPTYTCYITTVPMSQNSPHFALRPALFQIQVILRQVHECPQVDLEHYTRSNVPHICVTSIH